MPHHQPDAILHHLTRHRLGQLGIAAIIQQNRTQAMAVQLAAQGVALHRRHRAAHEHIAILGQRPGQGPHHRHGDGRGFGHHPHHHFGRGGFRVTAPHAQEGHPYPKPSLSSHRHSLCCSLALTIP